MGYPWCMFCTNHNIFVISYKSTHKKDPKLHLTHQTENSGTATDLITTTTLQIQPIWNNQMQTALEADSNIDLDHIHMTPDWFQLTPPPNFKKKKLTENWCSKYQIWTSKSCWGGGSSISQRGWSWIILYDQSVIWLTRYDSLSDSSSTVKLPQHKKEKKKIDDLVGGLGTKKQKSF